jgi:hypothetical protein
VEERQREGARPDRNGLPRWSVAVALLAVGALYAVLSDGLTLGPRAFLLGLVAMLREQSRGATGMGSRVAPGCSSITRCRGGEHEVGEDGGDATVPAGQRASRSHPPRDRAS